MTDTKTRPLAEAGLVAAQRRSMNNRDLIAGRCGCFRCLSTYLADRIGDWVDDGRTAICPVCGVDAVLSAATDAITEDALDQMHRRWFQSVTTGPLPPQPR